MIEKISSQSRTTEVHGVSRTMNTAYQQTGLTADSFLTGIFTNLVAKTDALGIAIDRSKAENITAEKDEVRDDAVRAVGYLVQGYQYHPEQTISDAAQVVNNLFNKYGFAVTEESYVTESSHIVSMLSDFSAPDVVTAIALLNGVAENIASLQAAEDDFETTPLVRDCIAYL